MTMREFVEFGDVGTYDEREAFETAMLQAHHASAEMGLTPPSPTVLEADCHQEWWCVAFDSAKRLGCF